MTRTIILAWVIGVLGLVMIGGGIWGLIDLFRQEVRAPLKSYGGAVSMICGGVAMLGVAQLYNRPNSSIAAFEKLWSTTNRINMQRKMIEQTSSIVISIGARSGALRFRADTSPKFVGMDQPPR